MAEIQPFAGIMYNTGRVQLAEVLTQPYDKITEEMRERYLAASPYNLVRIELGKDQPGDDAASNKYTRAAGLYRQWLREGILHRSAKPAFYWLEQTFVPPGGKQKLTRKGVIGRVRLSRWEEGKILPHEHTLSRPKADRLALLRAVGAQQGQIFMLHPDPIPAPKLDRPLFAVVDDYQVVNTLWEITDRDEIARIQAALWPQTFYIADGHHRYETALAYREEAGTEASQYVMATLVHMGDPGLGILPTHRTVSGIAAFDPRKFREAISVNFDLAPWGSAGIGMADALGRVALRLKDPAAIKPLFAGKPPLWETLDVAILHVAILEALLGIDEVRLREETNVAYWREPEKAMEQVLAGKAQLAFFLPPTPVSAVKAVADARSRMPQKSTDFYPKLLSGMVMYEVR
ncbi:MAG: DUF1015 domain-containing protein [Verrucomicrobiae bacterium]|nr:DUF1015 domain-containing protein [Verrucomicrobiae bacterium]